MNKQLQQTIVMICVPLAAVGVVVNAYLGNVAGTAAGAGALAAGLVWLLTQPTYGGAR